MSDAALISERKASTTAKVHPNITDLSHQGPEHKNTTHTPVSPTLQSEAATTTANGETSRVTTDGNIVRSDDPTTRPDASLGDKLKGDFKGAINGTLGSIEAAAGTVFRNKGLEQKGLDKMSEEDSRLAAKHGVMPVGSSYRMEAEGKVGPKDA